MAQFKKEYKFLLIGVSLGFVLTLLLFYLRAGPPALLPLTSIFDFGLKTPIGRATGTGTGTGTGTKNNVLYVITNSVELRYCQRDNCPVIAVLPYSTRVIKYGTAEPIGGRYWIQVQPEGGGEAGWADQQYFSNSPPGASIPDSSSTGSGGGGIANVNNGNPEIGGTGLYQIDGNDVNVRTCADINCRPLFRLDRGTPVTFLGRKDVGNGYAWVRIRIHGREGWVFGAHVVRL